MKKDVIYIDIEEEITGIISKLKGSKAKIVALVPPKRSTVLNSVVNLKLLKRAADDNKKRVVLITNERSLLALAGGLELFVAKNLHSKPEIPDGEGAPVADESVIEGTDMDLDPDKSIGELDEAHSGKSKVDLDDVNDTPAKGKKPKKMGAIKKNSFKVPNFEAFRLKMIFAVVAVVGLIGLWVWAFMIAPRATVDIIAQTSRIDTELPLDINNDAEASDIEQGVLVPEVQTITRTISEEYAATGEKDVGDKASGQMTIQNCRQSDSYEVVAGTTFTSESGLDFATDQTVVVPGGSFNFTGCQSPGETTVGVTAAQSGDNYNQAPQAYTTSTTGISGSGGQMSGGTSEKVKVVSKEDYDAAKKGLRDQTHDDVKTEILDLFGDDKVVIQESFNAKLGKFGSSPGVGKEAEKATISVEVTFTMLGVSRDELSQVIEADVNGRISTDQQSIYESGIDNVRFRIDEQVAARHLKVTATAATHVGPEINTEQLAEQISGLPFSEARSTVESLPGVRSVVVDFDPFWISKAPSANKITITIEIAENTVQ